MYLFCVPVQVGFSNHAILMLCGALSEMAKRVGISNGRYVKELENLSRSVHSLPPGPHMAALGGGLAAAGGAGAGLVSGSGVWQRGGTLLHVHWVQHRAHVSGQ
jgi:hypothetical protein